MIRKIKFRNKTGNNLVGILYTPKKIRNTIILSHGYLANKDGPGGLFIDLAKRLYGLNYQVLTFDYSFCGESEGCARDLRRSCLISDLSSAINYLNKKEIIKKLNSIKSDSIKELRGKGLMIGIEMKEKPDEIVRKCLFLKREKDLYIDILYTIYDNYKRYS